MFSHPSTWQGLINWISWLSARFAASLLANLPGISILASWKKCENSNPKPDFLKMAPACEDLTESSICTPLSMPLKLTLDSVSVQVSLPQGQSKPWFLHNSPCVEPTSSDQTEPLTLLCVQIFSLSYSHGTNRRQGHKDEHKDGHKDDVLGRWQLQLRASMAPTRTPVWL